MNKYKFTLSDQFGNSKTEVRKLSTVSAAVEYGEEMLKNYTYTLNSVAVHKNPNVLIEKYAAEADTKPIFSMTIAAIPSTKKRFHFLPSISSSILPSVQKEYVELWNLCTILFYHYLEAKMNPSEDDDDDDIIEVWDLTVYGGVEDASISIDLYNEDITPVCSVTLLDGTETTGDLFSLYFNPNDEDQPLSFNLNQGTLPNGDMSVIDVAADRVPASVLHNIIEWIRKQAKIQEG